MDPLTALGLAANIAQVIDLGAKLISTTKEIADAGKSLSVGHLSNITSDLIDLNATLARQIKRDTTEGVESTEEQKSLLDLAEECNKVASEFIRALEDVTQSGDKKSRWGNVRSALRTVWNKDRFELVARQLGEYRGQLALRVLLLLNASQRQQDDNIALLHEGNKEIIEVISINCGVLQSAIDGIYEGEQARQQRDYAESERRHAETIAAILTTRDGNSTAITGPHYAPDNSRHVSRLTGMRTTTTYRQSASDGALRSEDPPNFKTTEFTGFTKTILDALHFRMINARCSAVLKAHRHSFQWIYHDPEARDKPWDNFSEWLKFGRGCYWINGKAGSGKSTLMKFLQEDQRTAGALRAWLGQSELVFGSFFFWYAGTALQKSQAGLLRSLLHDVLRRRPELVPVLFPDVCRSILANQLHDSLDLSYIELKKAFTTFVSSVPAGLKVFFLIDGIDEYEGDHNEISELISQATTSDSVKILISSRPIPACVQAFSACPTLRLQDLTRKDVEAYVQDRLGRNPLMQKLEIADKGATSQLIENITSKASGVLLWVVLVVRSLLNGLQDYDTTPDLLQKVDELPPDLERLYDHMIGSMSPQHRRQGSKMLQLVLRSTETHDDYPMTLLQLSFAEDEDYNKAIEARISALSIQEEDWRCESTEGRMRSRCCGLIEVQSNSISSDLNHSRSHVGFLHRTVVEFLRTDTIRAQLFALTEKTKFDVDQALLSSSLAEMKAKPPAPEWKGYESTAYYGMLRILSYERHMEDTRKVFHTLYLPELMNTMSCYWHDPELFPTPEMEIRATTEAANRTSHRLDLAYPESFLLFAASQCPQAHLQGLLEWHIPTASETDNHDAKRDLLEAYLLIQYLDEMQVPLRILVSQNIMACGGNPNHSISLASKGIWNFRWKDAVHRTGDWCLWEAVLHHSHSITKFDDKEILNFVQTGLAEAHCNILISMLDAGADVNRSIVVVSKSLNSSRAESFQFSAAEVVHAFLWRVWRGQALKDPPTTAKARAAAKSLRDRLAEKSCILESTMATLLSTSLEPPQASPNYSKARTNVKESIAKARGLQQHPDKPEQGLSPWVLHREALPVADDSARTSPKAHQLRRQKKQKNMNQRPKTPFIPSSGIY
ncbi:hypothetical protein BP6252_13805 [Coleophoma cylindrospora]|uniref:NACHT domain-containing protein n=1 Tax=Coleophoma cylindrospora TaxID=1849047 RepID=A0A3D8Q702_9HELO|nr:hypothetical protein BP6252_13805 [Coleophoma cylindrospora]